MTEKRLYCRVQFSAGESFGQILCWNGYEGGSLDEFIKRADEIYPPDDEKNLQYRREHLAVIELFKALKGA